MLQSNKENLLTKFIFVVVVHFIGNHKTKKVYRC